MLRMKQDSVPRRCSPFPGSCERLGAQAVSLQENLGGINFCDLPKGIWTLLVLIDVVVELICRLETPSLAGAWLHLYMTHGVVANKIQQGADACIPFMCR